MAHQTPVAVVAAAMILAACSGPEYEADDPAPSAPASAAASAATQPPGITDSAQLSEPVVAQGVVTRADGTAVADALVELVAAPTEAQPAGTDPPEYLRTPVAAARTDPDGRYELRLASGLRAELPVDDAGLVEFGVVVDAPEGAGTVFWTGPGELTHPHTADLELDPDG